MSFKAPSHFSTAVPPVPDVKAWLEEFRAKHPYPNHRQKYEQEISTLNAQHDTMRMRFETLDLDHKTIQNSHTALNDQYNQISKQLAESNCKIKQLELENTRLKQQNELQSIEITALKQKVITFETSSGLDASCVLTANDENTNTTNTTNTITTLSTENHSTNTMNTSNTNGPNGSSLSQIQWNFNNISIVKPDESALKTNNTNNTNYNITTTQISQLNPTTDSSSTFNSLHTSNGMNARKRPRAASADEEIHDEIPSEQSFKQMTSHQLKKPKVETRASSMDRDSSLNILEKRLPSHLDMIRGDILAEAAGDDQILYCFSQLKKCSTEEWQLRNFLMQMITGLCAESESVEYSVIYDSRHIIKKQLTDLRSAIVKTTCEMLITFSKYCDRNRFGQCLGFFIPMHLQGLYVTIACIREAHSQCLSECIDNTRSFKCINPLLKGMTNKHSEVRVKVLQLLSRLVEQNGAEMNGRKMDKYADAIGNTIKTYVSDQSHLVRDACKKLFEQFAKSFPQKSRALLGRMDLNQQKTLRKRMGNKVKTNRRNASSNYGQVRTRRK